MRIGYLGRRLGYAVLTLFLVSVVVFSITQVLPGNAAMMILGDNALPGQVDALAAELGLDDPVYIQYGRWIGGFVQGDWGTSLITSQPVSTTILTALSRSAVLGGLTLAVTTVLAVGLGVLAALRRGRAPDIAVSVMSYLGVALPEFIIATLLLVVLAQPAIGIFPSGGYTPLAEGVWAYLRHLLLPALTLAIILTAHISRQTRSEMIDVMRTDYVRTAVLKGLRPTSVVKHALRNAMLPTITIIALDVGYLIGGIVVVEEVFAYPGLGRQLIFAMQGRDLPLIQAGVLVVAAAYIAANLAADLLYAALDRRVQYA